MFGRWFLCILDKHIKVDLPEDVTIIHLWGHSWELQDYNMWQQLEQFLKLLTKSGVQSKSNFEIFKLENILL